MTVKITTAREDLAALVEPVIPFADPKGLPALAGVVIATSGPYLTAMATDRHRAGIKRVAHPDAPAGFQAVVAATDLKHLLRVFKRPRGQDVQALELVFDDTTLTVSGSGLWSCAEATIKYHLMAGKYPVKAVRESIADALQPVPVGTAAPELNLNPRHVADLVRADPRNPVVSLVANAKPNGPVGFRVGDDFVGAIMQLRRDAHPKADPWDLREAAVEDGAA